MEIEFSCKTKYYSSMNILILQWIKSMILWNHALLIMKMV